MNPSIRQFAETMLDRCLDYAEAAKAAGRHIVGIMCEYTPRELIMAADGVPACLCGGSNDMAMVAEKDLPSNLCPLIKSTYGYHLAKENPFLEMAGLIVAETTCDGKKKMFELMAESRPMYILELPQKADDPDAFAHWVAELRKLCEFLRGTFHAAVTDDDIRAAIRTMNRERRLRRELAGLMKNVPPPLTGRELLGLKSIISCIPDDLAAYERIHAQLAAATSDPRLGSRVRVLLTGVPVVHGAERVVDIIEGHGGLVVCMENCTGLKPILEDVDEQAADPIVALAEKYFSLHCSVLTRNTRRLDWLKRLAAEYRPQCVVELTWHACLTYDVEAHMVKRLCETELGLPYLQIRTDYAPADTARIAVRVEALFETVRGR